MFWINESIFIQLKTSNICDDYHNAFFNSIEISNVKRLDKRIYIIIILDSLNNHCHIIYQYIFNLSYKQKIILIFIF
jgi:hypothetical protein